MGVDFPQAPDRKRVIYLESSPPPNPPLAIGLLGILSFPLIAGNTSFLPVNSTYAVSYLLAVFLEASKCDKCEIGNITEIEDIRYLSQVSTDYLLISLFEKLPRMMVFSVQLFKSY